MSKEMAAAMEAAKRRVEERKGARSASDVVNQDKKLRQTFSLRLNARELHRLRVIAMMENEGVTELARRLVLDGLLRLEHKHLMAAADKADKVDLVALVDQLNDQVDATKAVISMLSGNIREAARAGELVKEVPEGRRQKAKRA